MFLKPDTLALTAALALLISLGPLSTDLYLPSLPAIGAALGAATAETQLTLSAYLLGFALGQIIYGPLSDRHGRKPVLIGSLLLFGAAALACAASPTIETLIGARFVQALGGAGPIVLARAVARDLYSGPRVGQELSRMSMIMGLMPMAAPVLGGALQEAFGWRSGFLAMTAFGGAAFLIVAMALPETLRMRAAEPVTPAGVLRVYRILLRDAGYSAFVASACLTYGGLFAFISGSSFVLQGRYGLSPLVYGISFGLVALAFVSGAALGGRLVGRLGMDRTLGIGTGLLAIGGLGVLLGLAFGPGHPAEVVGPMAIYLIGVGVGLPLTVAGALTPFPDRAGAASSLLGFCQMTFAACVGVGVGHWLEESALPLGVATAVMGVLAFALHVATRRARLRTLAL